MLYVTAAVRLVAAFLTRTASSRSELQDPAVSDTQMIHGLNSADSAMASMNSELRTMARSYLFNMQNVKIHPWGQKWFQALPRWPIPYTTRCDKRTTC